mgnify:CR=1 FL=1
MTDMPDTTTTADPSLTTDPVPGATLGVSFARASGAALVQTEVRSQVRLAVVVAGGVGYEVQCPAGTLAKLVKAAVDWAWPVPLADSAT